MRNALVHTLPAAAGPNAPSFINSTTITGIISFVVFLVLSLVAIRLFNGAHKGDVKGAANSGIVVFIGCVILAMAGSALVMGVGSGVLNSLFNA